MFKWSIIAFAGFVMEYEYEHKIYKLLSPLSFLR